MDWVERRRLLRVHRVHFPRTLCASAALIPIGAAGALLDCQIAAPAAAVENKGGFAERLYRVRTAKRREGASQ